MRARLILGVIGTAVSALALVASAGAVGTSTRMPFTMDFFNPCQEEMFTATGFAHVTSDVTFGLDGSMHERYHVNLEGMTARGLLSGAKYVVQQEWNEGTNAHDDHTTIRHVFKEHFVRSGEIGTALEGDDFYFFVHTHITINGEKVTGLKVDGETECR